MPDPGHQIADPGRRIPVEWLFDRLSESHYVYTDFDNSNAGTSVASG